MRGGRALPRQERLTHSGHEHARAADARERLGRGVAVRRDRHELDLEARAGRDRVGDALRLCEGQGAAPSAEADRRRVLGRRRCRGHGCNPEMAGWKPARTFSQQPGRHTSYQGPSVVSRTRAAAGVPLNRSSMRSTSPLT